MAYHDEVANHLRIVCPSNSPDGSEYIQNYCISKSGEIINVLEYATLIASGKQTHVISFFDRHTAYSAKIRDQKKKFKNVDTCHELILDDRAGRKR